MTTQASGASAQRVIERFPQHWGPIQRLLRENDDFRELCQDYNDCVEALRHWSGSEAPNAQRWVDEYRVLQCELEAEILRFLKETDTD